MPRLPRVAAAIGLTVTLLGIAAAASPLRLPDSYFYERIAAQKIIPGCAEIHCFRPLVPLALGILPAGVAKWKAYAAVSNVGAALAVFDLSLVLGLTVRTSLIAGALSAFGFGSLYTLFEPFTGDPLMFWLAPIVTRLALQDRAVAAGALASVGVFAKEFIVAPLVIVGLADARAARWAHARRLAIAAAVAFVAWLGLQFALMWFFGYSYGDNKSPRIFSGGYLVFWLKHETVRGALSAMAVEFGALYLLMPFGFLKAPGRLREVAIAALPIACIFGYVQQPDRALWNFHFIATPLSALALEPLPNPLVVLFVALYGVSNLRIGAQVAAAPEARFAVVLTVALACLAIGRGRRNASAEMAHETS